jgi:hypothetical protein
VTTFKAGVDLLHPNATGRDLVTLLDGKAKRTAALNWYAGTRQPPQWACHLLASKINAHYRPLQAKLDAIATQLEQAPERPGLKAGAINLARWRARR